MHAVWANAEIRWLLARYPAIARSEASAHGGKAAELKCVDWQGSYKGKLCSTTFRRESLRPAAGRSICVGHRSLQQHSICTKKHIQQNNMLEFECS